MTTTITGNGVQGFADGAGADARFNYPYGIVVDGEGTIVVADTDNHRLRKIVDGQVTTLTGSSNQARPTTRTQARASTGHLLLPSTSVGTCWFQRLAGRTHYG